MSLAQRSATAQVFNEMHGLIVGVGKNFCLKSKPLCDQCPLKNFLPPRGPRKTSVPAQHQVKTAKTVRSTSVKTAKARKGARTQPGTACPERSRRVSAGTTER
jgi:adenine-specific DNA glycosylase